MLHCWPVIKHVAAHVGHAVTHHTHRAVGHVHRIGVVKAATIGGAAVVGVVCVDIPPWFSSPPPPAPPIGWEGPPPSVAFPPPWGYVGGGSLPQPGGPNGLGGNAAGPVSVVGDTVGSAVGTGPDNLLPVGRYLVVVDTADDRPKTSPIAAPGSLAFLVPVLLLTTAVRRRRKPNPVYAELLSACLEPYEDMTHADLILAKGHDFAADMARGRTALLELNSTTKET